MTIPPNTKHDSRIEARISPLHRTLLWAVAVVAAFLLGALGTAAVMSHRGGATPPALADRADTGGGEADAAKGGKAAASTITLDPDAARNAGVRAEPLAYRTVRDLLAVPGTVEVSSDRISKVTPPVAGKITGILVRLGETVRAGQPLATLDSQEVAQAQAAIRDADADLQQALAKARTAQVAVAQARDRQSSAGAALARQRELARAGAFAQAPLQAAQSERSQAESELLSAQAQQHKSAAAMARSEKLFQAGIDARADLEQAQTDARQADIRVDQAKARVTLAEQALAREQTVFRRDLLSQQAVQSSEAEFRNARTDVQRAQTEWAGAQAAVAGARQKTAGARANLRALTGDATVRIADGGRVTLLAPLGGTVAQQEVTLGQAVERSENLFTLENLNTVILQASVPEQDVARVRPGQRAEVTVDAFPNRTFRGRVQSLASQLDEKTRTLVVRCLVDNAAGRLRPEMFAQMRLEADASRRALVVPEAAIVTDENGATSVFVAGGKDGEYEKRPVRIGGSVAGGLVEILSGVEPGQRVVTEGAFVLKSEAQKGALKDSD